METLHSIVHDSSDGSALVFDFVVGRDRVGWLRHQFDAAGRYESIGRSTARDIRELIVADSPCAYVIEMRAAAGTLRAAAANLRDMADRAKDDGQADVAELLAERAGQIERERLLALDLVMDVCEDAWDDAVEHVERTSGADPSLLASALRRVELLWAARVAVRQATRSG